jgi:hypothetical protein
MTRRLAWIVLACVGLLTVAGEVLSARAGSGVDWSAVAVLPFPIVGALVASRQPHNALGGVLLGFGALVGLARRSTSTLGTR